MWIGRGLKEEIAATLRDGWEPFAGTELWLHRLKEDSNEST